MFERFFYKKIKDKSIAQKREGNKMLLSLLIFFLIVVIVSGGMHMLAFSGEEIVAMDCLIFLIYVIVVVSVFAIRYQKQDRGMPKDYVSYVIYDNCLYYVGAVILADSKYRHENSSHSNVGDYEKDDLTKRYFRDTRFILKLICGEETYEQIIVKRLSPIAFVSQKKKELDYIVIESASGNVRIFNNLERFDDFYEKVINLWNGSIGINDN